MAQIEAAAAKPASKSKNAAPSFGIHMPLMSSAFDTACWLPAAA